MRGKLIAGYRVVFGFLALGTFAVNLAIKWGDDGFHVSNFLSYFTIQSNVIGGVVLLYAAALFMRDRSQSATFELVRGAATLYLVTTGVVFAVLLSGLEGIEDAQPPLFNSIMHQVMPIVMLLDWLIDPPRIRLTFRRALVWLVYPLLYLAYSLIRGPIAADWYPYPFLDPNGPDGYWHVAIMSLGVAIWFVAATWGLVWIGNLLTARARPTVRQESSSPGR